MDNNKKNLRFTKDYNLPINIFNDDMFSYYRELYKDFWPLDAENRMNHEIEQFNGNVDQWLEHYGKIRDNIIFTIENSEEYKKFNNSNMSCYDVLDLGVGERSIYTEETVGKTFLSIDLKKANFQALKYASVLNDNTYADFIYRMNGSQYFADSKYLRQVIFGKLNPKRQIKVEKFIVYKIHKLVFSKFFLNELKLIYPDSISLWSFNSDEIIYLVNENYFNPTEDFLESVEDFIKESYGIEIRAELVKISRLNIVNCNGNKVDAYIRKNVFTGVETLKKASTTFFPQIWKLYKGLEIEEIDRMFYVENQIAIFKEPLELIK